MSPLARTRAARLAATALVIALAVLFTLSFRRGRYKTCGAVTVRLDTTDDCGACGVRCAAVNAQAACVEGKCELACLSGFADCDGHPGNGCETDLKSDRAHCGACIKSCGGALCEDGRCAGRLIGTGSHIAADERAVYALGPVVVKFPLDGSDAITLGAGDVPPLIAQAKAAPRPTGKLEIASGEEAFWVESGPRGALIRRAPRAGGEAVTVVTHPSAVKGLCANATHVFWADERQRIFMAPKR